MATAITNFATSTPKDRKFEINGMNLIGNPCNAINGCDKELIDSGFYEPSKDVLNHFNINEEQPYMVVEALDYFGIEDDPKTKKGCSFCTKHKGTAEPKKSAGKPEHKAQTKKSAGVVKTNEEMYIIPKEHAAASETQKNQLQSALAKVTGMVEELKERFANLLQ